MTMTGHPLLQEILLQERSGMRQEEKMSPQRNFRWPSQSQDLQEKRKRHSIYILQRLAIATYWFLFEEIMFGESKAAFRLSITSMDKTVKHYFPHSPPLRFLSFLLSSVRTERTEAWTYWREQKREKSQRWGRRKVVFDSHVHGRNW